MLCYKNSFFFLRQIAFLTQSSLGFSFASTRGGNWFVHPFSGISSRIHEQPRSSPSLGKHSPTRSLSLNSSAFSQSTHYSLFRAMKRTQKINLGFAKPTLPGLQFSEHPSETQAGTGIQCAA